MKKKKKWIRRMKIRERNSGTRNIYKQSNMYIRRIEEEKRRNDYVERINEGAR